jgi:hypothetical protein
MTSFLMAGAGGVYNKVFRDKTDVEKELDKDDLEQKIRALKDTVDPDGLANPPAMDESFVPPAIVTPGMTPPEQPTQGEIPLENVVPEQENLGLEPPVPSKDVPAMPETQEGQISPDVIQGFLEGYVQAYPPGSGKEVSADDREVMNIIAKQIGVTNVRSMIRQIREERGIKTPEYPIETTKGTPEITEVPVSSIKFSKDVPQFKRGATQEGVVPGQELKGD